MKKFDIHRERFNWFVCITMLVFSLSLLIPSLYFNWDGMVYFFKEKFNRPNETVVESYASIGNEDFDNLFERVFRLEQLSKEYNQLEGHQDEDYKLRTITYLRSCNPRYNDTNWTMLCGAVDEDFVIFVEENEGDKKDLSSFRPIDEGLETQEEFEEILFTIPSTGETVDFFHLFAVMNGVYLNLSQNITDLTGWAGDLVELIANGDESKFNINESSPFGAADVCADFDAVNILHNFDKSKDNLTNQISKYYKTIRESYRVMDFHEYTFNSSTKDELINEIWDRMIIGNPINPISYYAQTQHGLTFDRTNPTQNACVAKFAEYLLKF